MQLKKVLFIVPSFQRGGMENMLINIANIISTKADVTIYNLGSDDLSMVQELSTNIRYYSLWQPCKNILHGRVRDILKGQFRLLPAKYWYMAHSGKYIHRHMVSENFDVEIAFFVGEPMRIVSGCRRRQTRKIAWVHNDYSQCEGIFDCFPNKTSAQKAYKRFDEIVCVSKNAKEAFMKVVGYDKNCRVIYNYLPVEMIKKMSCESIAAKKSANIQLVVVGRLVKAKGVDRLLKALIKLKESGYDLGLWVVGDGVEHKQLEQYAVDNKLEKVKFWGLKENPYPYIAEADLLICSSRYEGYNLTVAEAIVLGTPVLSTECTGPTEILGDGKYGMIVDNSEEGLYEGLKYVAENPMCLEKYRLEAKQRAGFFSEDKIKKQLCECILKKEGENVDYE